MFLARFRWYRRWRGGKWALVTGMFWGKNWWRAPGECVERVDEEWFTWSWNPARRQAQMEERILVAMAELGQGRTGLTIHQRVEAQGTVDATRFYVALGQLITKDLVTSEKRRGGPERRYDHQEWWAYSLTEPGEDLVDHIFTRRGNERS